MLQVSWSFLPAGIRCGSEPVKLSIALDTPILDVSNLVLKGALQLNSDMYLASFIGIT